MKRALVCTMVFACAAVLAAGGAFAGTQDNAKLALHVQSVPLKNQCTAVSNIACDGVGGTSNLITNGPVLSNPDIYLLALDINTTAGIGGASMGVTHNAFVGGWTVCADQEFPGNGWPGSGGGNAITYASCGDAVPPGTTADASDPQGDGFEVLGYFTYVYSYDSTPMAITGRDYIPDPMKVADCTAAESTPPFPLFAGQVGFGSEPGYQPCVPNATPVEATTWGAVKSQFSND